jgi:ComF family protein
MHKFPDFLQRIIDYLFPPLCIVCDKPRPWGEKWLCSGCEAALIENNRYRDPCPRCAANKALGPCECRPGIDFPFDRAYSLFDFEDPVRSVLHHVKYAGKKHLAFDLALRFAPLAQQEFFEGIDGVVAVPLHVSRRRKRGYNQADYLARGLAEERRLPLFEGVLTRVRKTATQTTLNRPARRKNMKGAFAVPSGASERIRGASLLLIDDVMTTGSTTGEAAKALLHAGAASVRVLSFARD